VLVFALAFGAALAAVGEKGKPAVLFFASCNQALLHLVGWLMYAAPVGVGALIAARLGQAGGGAAFAAEIAAIGRYCVAVIFGLLVHACVVLPLALWVLTGRSPRRYAANMAEALVTAFSTASSSATLAVTMRCVEENRVRPATASFVLPLGATVNMDGTALYEAIAAMFIAQAWGVELSLGAQAVVALTATLASIGAAGIPQAGLVTMIMVLEAVGLPLEGIAAILAVDWFLDRCRTTVNVWGDAVAAAVVDATASGAPEKAG
jgi:Na+/H+-dicarboxylate symporter